jgi:serine/threonine-protein kinase
MFEILSGKMPIQAETRSIDSWYKAHHFQAPRSFETIHPRLNLPKQLEDLVMQCLAKSPDDRPQTVGEILASLLLLEQNFANTEQERERVGGGLGRRQSPSTPELQVNNDLSVEEACWQASWPANKPIAEIVFAQTIRAQQEVATLWVMLSREDIQRRLLSTRYNQFLCSMTPHPMMLWITAIYDSAMGVRWLPCYLDLKDSRGQQMALLLGKTGYYPLIFFALEEPQQSANVMMLTIAPHQRQLMRDWVRASQKMLSASSAHISKNLLKVEFEKIKPEILLKLEAAKGMMAMN